jgi:hypothetical protein
MIDFKLFKEFNRKTNDEVRWWAYAAWTIPFICLATIFFLDVIGWESTMHKVIITGGVLFFSIAVFWWWWAIFKLASIAKLMLNTANNLRDIGQELKSINKELHQDDK